MLTLGPASPETLAPKGFDLSLAGVSFPKTIETMKLKDEPKLNTLSLYCQIPLDLETVSVRNFKTCFGIFVAMNCNIKVNENV